MWIAFAIVQKIKALNTEVFKAFYFPNQIWTNRDWGYDIIVLLGTIMNAATYPKPKYSATAPVILVCTLL